MLYFQEFMILRIQIQASWQQSWRAIVAVEQIKVLVAYECRQKYNMRCDNLYNNSY